MVDTNLHRLLYVSSAVPLMSSGDLDDLLDVARARNHSNDVTGVLLYAEGNIMQMLEGPSENVQETFGRISRSRRHRGVIVLLNAAAPGRVFSTWSMAYSRATWGQLTEVQEACRESGDAAVKLDLALPVQKPAERFIELTLKCGDLLFDTAKAPFDIAFYLMAQAVFQLSADHNLVLR